RLQYARRFKRKKKLEVFGPFPTGMNIGEVLRLLTKSFRLRDCTLHDFKSRKEPCLLYQIDQCSAPCVGKIDRKDYQKDLRLALSYLSGQPKRALKFIEKRMLEAAKEERFEHAAILRDTFESLQAFSQTEQQRHAE